MAKMVWVKNNLNALVRYKLSKKTEDGSVQEEYIQFARQFTDRTTGRDVHNGYTQIPAETLELLKSSSKLFRDALEKKMYTIYETPPDDAFSPDQKIMQLLAQVGELQAQIVDLNTEISTRDARFKELYADKVALQKQIDAGVTAGGNEAEQAKIAALTDELGALQESFESYKETHPEIDETPEFGGQESPEEK